MRAGLPLKVEGGKIQLRAASSAAARSKVGPFGVGDPDLPVFIHDRKHTNGSNNVVVFCGVRIAGRYSLRFAAIERTGS